eukprot:CAMPEP_0171175944 /NCGR_PEP_ID=MMETSP0790-20130122/11486_1 /TAXON_ID=2925 /ORGANISM="Alexandrium catenella, Strain OF101" /LENGTH=513 /DNA_ID=CAMNT_0011640829 /DNA_START=46 /DNA_END=1587 /DNA_ORIENTATION=-
MGVMDRLQRVLAEQVLVDGAKRIAVVTVPLSGHRRLAISLASEMAVRGFPVDFLIGADGVNDELRRMERDYPHFTLHAITQGRDIMCDVDWQRVASSSGRLGGSKYALLETLEGAFRNIDGAVEHWREMIKVLSESPPDVVVLDHAQKVMQQWAEDNGIPSVIMHTPYYLTGPPTGCARVTLEDQQRTDELMEARNPFRRLDEATERLGVKGQETAFDEGEDGAREARGLAPHTLVFCEPELLHVQRLPPRVHAVGPCLSDRDPLDVDEHLLPWLDGAASARQRVLYVAFGTLANGFLTPAAVGTLLNAFAGLGDSWRVLWSLPRQQQALLAQSGRAVDEARLRVEPFVRQRAVLAHPAVRVFLTHAGQSSTNEGIAAARPLVCMPLFCDQYEMAESVSRHGLGLVYHKDELLDGQAQRLCSLVRQVDEEPLFRATVGRHAQLVRIRGGCRRAAEVIESIAYAGADFGELWQGAGADEDAPSPASAAPGPTLLRNTALAAMEQVKRPPNAAEH